MSFDLATPRLKLRPCHPADIDALHRLWTDPGVRKYLWDDEVISHELAGEIVANSIDDFATRGFGHWIITRKEQNELIGWAGLREFGTMPAIEVLYGITPACWGQGLAVEATRAILHYGFTRLNLSRIYAGTDAPNTASLRVMEKLGMRFDKRIQDNGSEAIYYVLSREEFFAQ
jgi:RimJ/RimL family protein N-acetyltransferase